MSYTSPKYTYVSSQPAYERMQQQFTQAASTIASKIETERKRGEELAAKGRAGSQAYINKAAEYNSVGNQATQGAVTKLFEGTGKRVGELIRLTQGTNPQCTTDGNCEELQAELAELQKGPATVKDFITNLSDQLDYEDILNFDEGQNSNGVLASNILGGKSGFNEANGYSYELVNAGGGSYDIVFKSDKDEFYNPDTGEYSNEFKLNSAAFADMAHNEKSYFASTPTADQQKQEILGEAGGAGIYKYDKDGNKTGTYDVKNYLKDPGARSSYEVSKSNKEGVADTLYGVVDMDKLKADTRIMGAISAQLKNFTGNVNDDIAGIDDGEARAFFNKVLSNQTDMNSFDVELMRSTLSDYGKNLPEGTTLPDTTDMEDDEIRELFNKTMGVFDENGKQSKFGYREDLSVGQKHLFNALYTNYMLGQIRDEMMQDFDSRRIALNPDFKQDDETNFLNQQNFLQNSDDPPGPDDEYPA